MLYFVVNLSTSTLVCSTHIFESLLCTEKHKHLIANPNHNQNTKKNSNTKKKKKKNLKWNDLKSTENMLNMKIVAKIIKALVTHMRTTGMFHLCARVIEEFLRNIFITIIDSKRPAKFYNSKAKLTS